MNLLTYAMRTLTGEKRSVTSWASTDPLPDSFFGGRRKAGQKITAETSLAIMAVYAAVRLIAEGLGSLPVKAYREDDDGNPVPRALPAWLDIPNAPLNLTKQDLISQIVVSLLLRGNAYIMVIRPGFGEIEGLEVLDPDTVALRREGFRVIYSYNGRDFSADEIRHIRGLTLPGELEGVDPITHAAATLGIGLAAQEYGASFMENASLPSGIVKVPGSLSDTAAKLLRKAWDAIHSGAANAGNVAVLTEGAEFMPISLTPEQTQFLEARRFTVQDVARLFGVPPHLLADASNSTSWGSGLAEQNTAMSRLTFGPWIARLEMAFRMIERTTVPDPRNYIRIHPEGFERGAYADRITTYAAGIAAGIYTTDEVRAWEELPAQRTAEYDPRAVAEALQKIYLAVGPVIETNEAREIVGGLGFPLPPQSSLQTQQEPPA